MKNHLRENLLAIILSIKNIRGLGTPLNQQNKPRNITVRHKTVSGMVCLSRPFWSLCNVLDSKPDKRVVLQVLGTSTDRNGMIYPTDMIQGQDKSIFLGSYSGSSSIDGPHYPAEHINGCSRLLVTNTPFLNSMDVFPNSKMFP